MGRMLVLILIVVLVVWLLRRALKPAAPKPRGTKAALEGELVACARCGLNLPRSEAREANGEVYCSDEHARLGA